MKGLIPTSQKHTVPVRMRIGCGTEYRAMRMLVFTATLQLDSVVDSLRIC